MTPALVRREALTSAAINAAIGAGFFLALFGLDERVGVAALGYDFLPQAFMVGLAAALVPVLIVRQRLGIYEPTGRIVARALALAAVSMVVAGGGALLVCRATGAGSLDPIAALATKMAFGAVLGSVVTVLALRRLPMLQEIRS